MKTENAHGLSGLITELYMIDGSKRLAYVHNVTAVPPRKVIVYSTDIPEQGRIELNDKVEPLSKIGKYRILAARSRKRTDMEGLIGKRAELHLKDGSKQLVYGHNVTTVEGESKNVKNILVYSTEIPGRKQFESALISVDLSRMSLKPIAEIEGYKILTYVGKRKKAGRPARPKDGKKMGKEKE